MDKSGKHEFPDTEPPKLWRGQTADSFKRHDLPRNVFQTHPFAAPLVGVLAIIALGVATYSLLWGEHSALALTSIFVLGLAVVALVMPIEWLLMLNVAAFILADTYLDLRSLNYHYTRFVPLGMFAVRALLPSVLQKVRTYMLPDFFLIPFGLFFVMALVSASYDKLDPSGTFLRALTMGFALVAFGIGLPAYFTDDQKLRRGLHSILTVLALSVVGRVDNNSIESKTVLHLGDYSRVRGIYVHPNTLGLMAMLTFFPILGWRMETPRGKRWPLTIVLFALLIALLASGSRASFAGLVSGAIVLLTIEVLKHQRQSVSNSVVCFCLHTFFWLTGDFSGHVADRYWMAF